MTPFLTEANDTLLRLGNAANEAAWVQATYITPDTQAISARATDAYVTAATNYAKKAASFGDAQGRAEERRQLTVLKNTLTMAAPADPREATEMTRIAASMEAAYGSGKYCPGGEAREDCLDVEAVTKILADNRVSARLREVWEGWHTIAPPMKKDYARFVELSNKGAKEIGFADTGLLWRARYDMPPEVFGKELDRLWEQLRPLYLSLHAFVCARLHDKYGDAVPADGPIPAHLLGNIWAQDWTNVYDLVAPPSAGRRVPLDSILQSRKVSATEMVRYGERFFTSLGFEPLPPTFWERSLLVKPATPISSSL